MSAITATTAMTTTTTTTSDGRKRGTPLSASESASAADPTPRYSRNNRANEGQTDLQVPSMFQFAPPSKYKPRKASSISKQAQRQQKQQHPSEGACEQQSRTGLRSPKQKAKTSRPAASPKPLKSPKSAQQMNRKQKKQKNVNVPAPPLSLRSSSHSVKSSDTCNSKTGRTSRNSSTHSSKSNVSRRSSMGNTSTTTPPSPWTSSSSSSPPPPPPTMGSWSTPKTNAKSRGGSVTPPLTPITMTSNKIVIVASPKRSKRSSRSLKPRLPDEFARQKELLERHLEQSAETARVQSEKNYSAERKQFLERRASKMALAAQQKQDQARKTLQKEADKERLAVRRKQEQEEQQKRREIQKREEIRTSAAMLCVEAATDFRKQAAKAMKRVKAKVKKEEMRTLNPTEDNHVWRELQDALDDQESVSERSIDSEWESSSESDDGGRSADEMEHRRMQEIMDHFHS